MKQLFQKALGMFRKIANQYLLLVYNVVINLNEA